MAEALDLETEGLMIQATRLRLTRASAAMITTAALMVGASLAWQAAPERGATAIDRDPFAIFPRDLGDWRQLGAPHILDAGVAETLAADDYRSVTLQNNGAEATVELFMAWYADQSQGGVHSPEICLPGGGWEIAWLERSDLTQEMGWERPFMVNRAIIQKGETRMMVFYWFEQKGRKIAWDMAAKYWLLVDGVKTGRTDGALVRLTTPILPTESDAAAEVRLMDVLRQTMEPLPRFIPGA